MSTTQATATPTPTALHSAYVKVTVELLRGWVGRDAPRSKAARVLSEWQFAAGLAVDGADLTPRVLDHFDADSDPVAGLDYLPDGPSHKAALVSALLEG